MKSRFVSAAESEFAGAASFYEDAEPGLGEEFVFSILGHVDLLTKHPNLGREVDSGIRTNHYQKISLQLDLRRRGR